jgi:hypothetical protein
MVLGMLHVVELVLEVALLLLLLGLGLLLVTEQDVA